MSEKKKEESITEQKISRRSMLKWTGALATAFAVGAVSGYGATELVKPMAPTITTTIAAGTTTLPAAAAEEKVFIQYGVRSEPILVYVKNGRIIRIRPAKLPANQIANLNIWNIKVGDKTYAPTARLGAPRITWMSLAMRKRVYSPQRIRYPMKRVDFTATSDGKNRNTQNRGVSKFVRISWDEALNTIASELKRVNATYGPASVVQLYPSHIHPGRNSLSIHELYRSVWNRTLCTAFGGHTALAHSPDSWEGWAYGGSFVWGYSWSFGLASKSNIEDAMLNSKLIVDWSFDPLAQTPHAQFSIEQPWFRELGIRRYNISPDLNWTAIAYADKWIPVLPGTDSYMAAAIANVWITEGTYDKDYVATHTFGFDKFKDYIMGVSDGVPKTPAWAEPKCGLKARIIRALAREWGAKPTMVGFGIGGTVCRVPYGHEITRYIALLLAMQGLGKPGRSWAYLQEEPPNPSTTWTLPQSTGNSETWGNLTWVAKNNPGNTVPQFVWKTGFPVSILNPPQEWWGMGLTAQRPVPPAAKPWWPHVNFVGGPGWTAVDPNPPQTSQYAMAGCHYTYPMKGYSEIHALMTSSTAFLGCWTGGQDWIKAYQSPKLEFIFALDYWWGGQATQCDILLPVATCLEKDDMVCSTSIGTEVISHPQRKVIEPLWESKSDFWIEGAIADKLGVLDKVHEGLDEMGWLRKMYSVVAISQFQTFDEWWNMSAAFPEGTLPTYFEYPYNPKQVVRSLGQPGMRAYAELPEGKGLDTKSGKIEFYSQYIADWFPGDTERPPVPQVSVPSWDGLESPGAKKYTLLVDSPHPRFRLHTQFEETTWMWEISGHKMYKDGYPYECLWMHPVDAAKRGIKHGDLVRGWNDRGQALFAAYVSHRVPEGIVRAPDGCYYDPIDHAGGDALDKGGCMNYLSPGRYQSKHASSMTPSAFMIEVEKYTGTPGKSMSEVRIQEQGA